MKTTISEPVKIDEKVYKLLWIEDLEDDILLAERKLRHAGLQFKTHQVMTKEAFLDGIENFKPDVILSDHSLPQFNSSAAYELYREKNLQIPFILVTGTVSEEFAVDCLQLGIDDYVLKSSLGGPVRAGGTSRGTP